MQQTVKYHFLWISLWLIATSAGAGEWWELETRMNPGGKLDLTQKSWWPQALSLKNGEHFIVPSAYPGGGKMIVRREARKRSRNPEDMIVWILDDDNDLPANSSQGDMDNDCYVADYGCDGIPDRIVDYLDTDGDQIPDEMDIRYFVDGELRRAWFGTDLDGDGEMWDTEDYEYTGNFFQSDPYGNNEIYMNKYNPKTDRWIPISECPFSFYDMDSDNQSEAVVRFSVAPLTFSQETDPDYANSQRRYEGRYDPNMEQMGVVNVRYSLDIDDCSDDGHPLHYEMGFNMVGELPYEFGRMARTQALRRPPKTTLCIPFDAARQVSESYPAIQTGFSWHEYEDASIRIGYPKQPESDRRWEGVFWTWQRRIMHNTGGPVQHWNIRREFLPAYSEYRELYYSPVDRRIHLKGATEGWLHVGYIGSETEMGEIRTFDTNQNGYFDRWEYYWRGEDRPYRVASVPDAENRDLSRDWDDIKIFLNQTLLPESIQLNEALIEQLKQYCSDSPVPVSLKDALRKDISPNERRYILDCIREYLYRHFMQHARKVSQQQVSGNSKQDPRRDVDLRNQSENYWNQAAQLSLLDAAYARGDYKKVMEILETLNTR